MVAPAARASIARGRNILGAAVWARTAPRLAIGGVFEISAVDGTPRRQWPIHAGGAFDIAASMDECAVTSVGADRAVHLLPIAAGGSPTAAAQIRLPDAPIAVGLADGLLVLSGERPATHDAAIALSERNDRLAFVSASEHIARIFDPGKSALRALPALIPEHADRRHSRIRRRPPFTRTCSRVASRTHRLGQIGRVAGQARLSPSGLP